ncbi:protein kinase [Sorangium cellulosum]|uniref:Protein kinase n=1 Tax=Sorangium cellulosum TaxID=56 RepID=A0A4P2Q094_SORCE|nr:serine/threonine-protein kinase [Sorangium cellulosum]AUX22213.1 protein kinase [Sorangium cellulosum]
MAHSSGEPDSPQGEDSVGPETAAFPLGGGESRADNVYTIAPGTVIARKYRVERTIGRGGMGLVVEALHLDLDTRVAIKFLLPEFMSYTEAAERFMREARTVAKLQTPHVVRVLDVAALESGEPYMVMELLDGEDLACHAAEAGTLAIGECIDHIVQACEALAEAHALGIVHRDLKPANLFLTRRPDGASFVKVLDFGVSKILTGDTGNVSLTQTTTILGSALYMSPEQMRSSKSVDPRTDIYALGVCLFEIIGGRPPYVADSFPELCAKIYTSPPEPLQELRPEVPEGLVEVIERSIAREPEDRFQSIAEFVQALAPFAAPSTRATIAGILRQHAVELDLPPPASRGALSRSMARTSRRSSGGLSVSERGARTTDAAPPGEDEAPRRGRPLLYVAVGAVAVAVGAWGALQFQRSRLAVGEIDATSPAPAASAPSEAAAPAEQAEPAPQAPGAAVASPGVAPASEAANADAGASAADAGAADAGAVDAEADASASPAGASADDGTGAKAASSSAPSAGRGKAPRSSAGGRGRTQGAGRSSPAPSEEVEPPRTVVAPTVNSDLSLETCTATMPDGTKKVVPCK